MPVGEHQPLPPFDDLMDMKALPSNQFSVFLSTQHVSVTGLAATFCCFVSFGMPLNYI